LAWAYNEEINVEDFITKSIRDLERVSDDFELILVDDGSTDATGSLIEKYARKDGRIKLIKHSYNMNVGKCIPHAVKAATKEILFWNTFDNSYDTADLERYLKWLDHYDIVQCVRPHGGSDNLIKHIISRVNYFILRLASGVPMSDFQNRTFHRTRRAQKIVFESNSAITNPEMLIKCYYEGAAIAEVPLEFTRREKGEAKGTKLPFLLRSIGQVLRWALLWRFRAFPWTKAGTVTSVE